MVPTRSWQGMGEERERVSTQVSSEVVGAVAVMWMRCWVGVGVGRGVEGFRVSVDGVDRWRASMVDGGVWGMARFVGKLFMGLWGDVNGH